MNKSKFRSHGLNYPPNTWQTLFSINTISSSILTPLSFFTLQQKPAKITLSILFFTTLAYFLYIWVTTTLSDPTDNEVLSNRKSGKISSDSHEHFCSICSSHVGKATRHCAVCNRCVAEFDHHCIWLNNCIGKKNYHLFVKLISALLLHEAVIIISSCFVLKELFDFSFVNTSLLFSQIYLLLQGFVIFFFLFYLVLFHLYLYKNSLTTYEFIKAKKKRSKVSSIDQIETNQTSRSNNPILT